MGAPKQINFTMRPGITIDRKYLEKQTGKAIDEIAKDLSSGKSRIKINLDGYVDDNGSPIDPQTLSRFEKNAETQINNVLKTLGSTLSEQTKDEITERISESLKSTFESLFSEIGENIVGGIEQMKTDIMSALNQIPNLPQTQFNVDDKTKITGEKEAKKKVKKTLTSIENEYIKAKNREKELENKINSASKKNNSTYEIDGEFSYTTKQINQIIKDEKLYEQTVKDIIKKRKNAEKELEGVLDKDYESDEAEDAALEKINKKIEIYNDLLFKELIGVEENSEKKLKSLLGNNKKDQGINSIILERYSEYFEDYQKGNKDFLRELEYLKEQKSQIADEISNLEKTPEGKAIGLGKGTKTYATLVKEYLGDDEEKNAAYIHLNPVINPDKVLKTFSSLIKSVQAGLDKYPLHANIAPPDEENMQEYVESVFSRIRNFFENPNHSLDVNVNTQGIIDEIVEALKSANITLDNINVNGANITGANVSSTENIISTDSQQFQTNIDGFSFNLNDDMDNIVEGVNSQVGNALESIGDSVSSYAFGLSEEIDEREAELERKAAEATNATLNSNGYVFGDNVNVPKKKITSTDVARWLVGDIEKVEHEESKSARDILSIYERIGALRDGVKKDTNLKYLEKQTLPPTDNINNILSSSTELSNSFEYLTNDLDEYIRIKRQSDTYNKTENATICSRVSETVTNLANKIGVSVEEIIAKRQEQLQDEFNYTSELKKQYDVMAQSLHKRDMLTSKGVIKDTENAKDLLLKLKPQEVNDRIKNIDRDSEELQSLTNKNDKSETDLKNIEKLEKRIADNKKLQSEWESSLTDETKEQIVYLEKKISDNNKLLEDINNNPEKYNELFEKETQAVYAIKETLSLFKDFSFDELTDIIEKVQTTTNKSGLVKAQKENINNGDWARHYTSQEYRERYKKGLSAFRGELDEDQKKSAYANKLEERLQNQYTKDLYKAQQDADRWSAIYEYYEKAEYKDQRIEELDKKRLKVIEEIQALEKESPNNENKQALKEKRQERDNLKREISSLNNYSIESVVENELKPARQKIVEEITELQAQLISAVDDKQKREIKKEIRKKKSEKGNLSYIINQLTDKNGLNDLSTVRQRAWNYAERYNNLKGGYNEYKTSTSQYDKKRHGYIYNYETYQNAQNNKLTNEITRSRLQKINEGLDPEKDAEQIAKNNASIKELDNKIIAANRYLNNTTEELDEVLSLMQQIKVTQGIIKDENTSDSQKSQARLQLSDMNEDLKTMIERLGWNYSDIKGYVRDNKNVSYYQNRKAKITKRAYNDSDFYENAKSEFDVVNNLSNASKRVEDENKALETENNKIISRLDSIRSQKESELDKTKIRERTEALIQKRQEEITNSSERFKKLSELEGETKEKQVEYAISILNNERDNLKLQLDQLKGQEETEENLEKFVYLQEKLNAVDRTINSINNGGDDYKTILGNAKKDAQSEYRIASNSLASLELTLEEFEQSLQRKVDRILANDKTYQDTLYAKNVNESQIVENQNYLSELSKNKLIHAYNGFSNIYGTDQIYTEEGRKAALLFYSSFKEYIEVAGKDESLSLYKQQLEQSKADVKLYGNKYNDVVSKRDEIIRLNGLVSEAKRAYENALSKTSSEVSKSEKKALGENYNELLNKLNSLLDGNDINKELELLDDEIDKNKKAYDNARLSVDNLSDSIDVIVNKMSESLIISIKDSISKAESEFYSLDSSPENKSRKDYLSNFIATQKANMSRIIEEMSNTSIDKLVEKYSISTSKLKTQRTEELNAESASVIATYNSKIEQSKEHISKYDAEILSLESQISELNKSDSDYQQNITKLKKNVLVAQNELNDAQIKYDSELSKSNAISSASALSTSAKQEYINQNDLLFIRDKNNKFIEDTYNALIVDIKKQMKFWADDFKKETDPVAKEQSRSRWNALATRGLNLIHGDKETGVTNELDLRKRAYDFVNRKSEILDIVQKVINGDIEAEKELNVILSEMETLKSYGFNVGTYKPDAHILSNKININSRPYGEKSTFGKILASNGEYASYKYDTEKVKDSLTVDSFEKNKQIFINSLKDAYSQAYNELLNGNKNALIDIQTIINEYARSVSNNDKYSFFNVPKDIQNQIDALNNGDKNIVEDSAKSLTIAEAELKTSTTKLSQAETALQLEESKLDNLKAQKEQLEQQRDIEKENLNTIEAEKLATENRYESQKKNIKNLKYNGEDNIAFESNIPNTSAKIKETAVNVQALANAFNEMKNTGHISDHSLLSQASQNALKLFDKIPEIDVLNSFWIEFKQGRLSAEQAAEGLYQFVAAKKQIEQNPEFKQTQLSLVEILKLLQKINYVGEKGVLFKRDKSISSVSLGSYGKTFLNDMSDADTMLHVHPDNKGTFSGSDIQILVDNWKTGIRKLQLIVDNEFQELDFSNMGEAGKAAAEAFNSAYQKTYNALIADAMNKGLDPKSDEMAQQIKEAALASGLQAVPNAKFTVRNVSDVLQGIENQIRTQADYQNVQIPIEIKPIVNNELEELNSQTEQNIYSLEEYIKKYKELKNLLLDSKTSSPKEKIVNGRSVVTPGEISYNQEYESQMFEISDKVMSEYGLDVRDLIQTMVVEGKTAKEVAESELQLAKARQEANNSVQPDENGLSSSTAPAVKEENEKLDQNISELEQKKKLLQEIFTLYKQNVAKSNKNEDYDNKYYEFLVGNFDNLDGKSARLDMDSFDKLDKYTKGVKNSGNTRAFNSRLNKVSLESLQSIITPNISPILRNVESELESVQQQASETSNAIGVVLNPTETPSVEEHLEETSANLETQQNEILESQTQPSIINVEPHISNPENAAVIMSSEMSGHPVGIDVTPTEESLNKLGQVYVNIAEGSNVNIAGDVHIDDSQWGQLGGFVDKLTHSIESLHGTLNNTTPALNAIASTATQVTQGIIGNVDDVSSTINTAISNADYQIKSFGSGVKAKIIGTDIKNDKDFADINNAIEEMKYAMSKSDELIKLSETSDITAKFATKKVGKDDDGNDIKHKIVELTALFKDTDGMLNRVVYDYDVVTEKMEKVSVVSATLSNAFTEQQNGVKETEAQLKHFATQLDIANSKFNEFGLNNFNIDDSGKLIGTNEQSIKILDATSDRVKDFIIEAINARTEVNNLFSALNQSASQGMSAEAFKRASDVFAVSTDEYKAIINKVNRNVRIALEQETRKTLEKFKDQLVNVISTTMSEDGSFKGFDVNELNSEGLKYVNELKNLLDELSTLYETFQASDNFTIEQRQQWSSLLSNISETKKKIKAQSSLKENRRGTYIENLSISKDDYNKLSTDANFARETLTRLAQSINGVDIQTEELSNNNKTLTYSFTDMSGNIQTCTLSIGKFGNEVRNSIKNSTPKVNLFSSAFGGLRNKMAELAKYFSAYQIFYKVLNAFRSGISIVKELDSAMTEMRKVSEASEQQLKSFSRESHKIAQEIGSTASTIQNSAADWMRLGYSINEASELAKNTSILMNVSEFDSIDSATESMVAMVQAFKDADQDVGDLSLEIIDKLNNIGNNFSISTSELAESLKRSSGTLIAAGNTIDEAIALTTAGNAIIQDAETTGSALKVISMRIRGTTAQALEDEGEDAEGLIETTSKLESKVKSLTAVNGKLGVSILDANGNYRTTYEILQDIADLWEEIGNADVKDGKNRQAALLEALAGKTRAQSLASLLQNPEMMKNVYESVQDSQGSAQEENEKWLESIEAHQQLLTAKWQEFWDSAINREQINWILDRAMDLLDILNDIGSVNALLLTGSFIGGAKLGYNDKGIFSTEAYTKYSDVFNNFSESYSASIDKLSNKISTFKDNINSVYEINNQLKNLEYTRNDKVNSWSYDQSEVIDDSFKTDWDSSINLKNFDIDSNTIVKNTNNVIKSRKDAVKALKELDFTAKGYADDIAKSFRNLNDEDISYALNASGLTDNRQTSILNAIEKDRDPKNRMAEFVEQQKRESEVAAQKMAEYQENALIKAQEAANKKSLFNKAKSQELLEAQTIKAEFEENSLNKMQNSLSHTIDDGVENGFNYALSETAKIHSDGIEIPINSDGAIEEINEIKNEIDSLYTYDDAETDILESYFDQMDDAVGQSEEYNEIILETSANREISVETISAETVAEEENISAKGTNATTTAVVTNSETQRNTALAQEKVALIAATEEEQQKILADLTAMAGEEGLTKAKLENIAATNTQAGALARLILAEKTASTATKILQGALSGLTMMAVMFAVTQLIQYFSNLTHEVENCSDKVSDLISDFNQKLNTVNNNIKSFESIADKYSELSKGVDNLGNNVSLTSKEFDEYNNIVNKIADMSPDLVSGWTNEGNAILSIKGNVDVTESYKKAQIEAYNTLISNNTDDIINNWKNTHQVPWTEDILPWLNITKAYREGISDKDAIDSLNKLIELSDSDFNNIFGITGVKTIDSKQLEKMRSDINDLFLIDTFDLNQIITKDYTSEEISQIKTKAKALISTYQASIDSALSGVISLANAYLNVNTDYQSMDSDLQTIASKLVNSLTEETAIQFENETDVSAYVNGIVDALNNATPEIQNQIIALFNLDTSDMTVGAAQKTVAVYLAALKQAFGNDVDGYNNVLELLDIDENNLLPTDFAEDVNAFKSKYSNSSNLDENEIANSFVETLNAQELEYANSDAFEKAIEKRKEALDGAQLTLLDYKNALQEVISATPTIPDYNSVSDIMKSSVRKDESDNDVTLKDEIDTYTSEISALEGYLEKLQNGTYTNTDLTELSTEFGLVGNSAEELSSQIQTLMNMKLDSLLEIINQIINDETEKGNSKTVAGLEQVKTYLIGIKNEALNATNALKTTKDTISNIQNLSSGMSQIASIYSDVKDKGEFDWSSIINNENFKTTFSMFKTEYDALINSILDNPKDLSKNKKAFDDLVDAYIKGTGVLDNLTESEKEHAKTLLDSLGITNSAEMVEAELVSKQIESQVKLIESRRQNKIDLAENIQGEKERAATIDQANLSAQNEIATLFEEGSALQSATEAQKAYYLAKQVASFDFVNGDINQLDAIVKALGIGVDAWGAYYAARSQLDSAISNNLPTDAINAIKQQVKAKMDAFSEELNNVASSYDYGGAKNAASGGGSEAGDAYVEAFEKELEQLDKLKDAGIISEREYLNRLKALYVKYFANKKQYYEKFRQYEKQYLEGKIICPKQTISVKMRWDAQDRGKTNLNIRKELMANRKTHEEYVKEVKNISPWIMPLEKYINTKTRIKHLCTKHNNEWYSYPSNILKGCGCSDCGKEKKINKNTKYTQKIYEEILNKKSISLLDCYKGLNTSIYHRCNICNHEWCTQPRSIIIEDHGCPQCGIKNNAIHRSIGIDNYKNRIHAINTNIELVDNYYINNCTPLNHRCLICNHIWRAMPENILSGHGCPKCRDIKTGIRFQKTHNEFIDDFNKRNPNANNIEIISEYTNVFVPIKCICKRCDNIWETTPSSLLHRKSGCPKCSSSIGEKTINNWLIENNIYFESQKTFSLLKGINGGLLSYDFYIPQYNKLIEYQGMQHYVPIDYFGGEKKFEIQQEHDKRKRDYAKKHNLELIEIKYDEDIYETLNNIFKLESVETAVSM